MSKDYPEPDDPEEEAPPGMTMASASSIPSTSTHRGWKTPLIVATTIILILVAIIVPSVVTTKNRKNNSAKSEYSSATTGSTSEGGSLGDSSEDNNTVAPSTGFPTMQPSGLLLRTTAPPTTEPVTGNPTMRPTPLRRATSTPSAFQPVASPTNSPSGSESGRPTFFPTIKNPTISPTRPRLTVGTTIVNATFDSGLNKFVYRNDLFRNTNNPGFVAGIAPSTGILQVDMVGTSDSTGSTSSGISGGWERSFVLTESVPLTLSVRFQLIQYPGSPADEITQALLSVDGKLMGQAPFDYLGQVVGGDGDSSNGMSTGWKSFDVNLGTLTLGSHSLALGGFQNKKSTTDRTTTILFDYVKLLVGDQSISSTSGPAQVVQRLELQKFKDNVAMLASFGDRTQGTTSYNTAAAWVESQLSALGYTVEHHYFSYGDASRSNIYVTNVGRVYPDRMFIVSAHLDGRGGGGAANDDGSGCSLVLEMARVFAGTDVTTDISVRFIFWNNEETGLNGSGAYARDRKALQGKQSPTGSGLYPEPTWLGIVTHDQILFDHGTPAQTNQSPYADADIEYGSSSVFVSQSLLLANALQSGNQRYTETYPAEVSGEMCCTDSESFQNVAPAISVRENRRLAEIGQGAAPHWHQVTDVYTSYSEADFLFGLDIVRTTTGTIGEFTGLRVS